MKVNSRLVSALLAFTLTWILASVEGHGSGAPESRCESMNPGHWVSSQTTPSPYTVTLDKTSVPEGSPVTLSLVVTSPDQPGFKGFFVMVKKPLEDAGNYGTFDLANSDLVRSRPVTCFGREASAMTHKDNIEKSLVRLVWVAPSQISEPSEDFEVKVTFVQNFWTIYANLTGPQRITVKKQDDLNQHVNMTHSTDQATSPRIVLAHKSSLEPRDALSDLPISTSKNNGSTTNSSTAPTAIEGEGAWGHFKGMWISMLNYFGA